MFGPESKIFGKASKLNKSNGQYPGQQAGDIPVWMNAYEYDKGIEVLAPDGNYYRCLVDHISDNFITDLGLGNWVIFAGPGIDNDNQTISLDPDGVTLRLSNGIVPDTTVDLTPFLDNTDGQTLSLAGTLLSISNGNSIDLASFLDNTDSQVLSLVGTVLSISGGNSIDLISFLDNTDAQTLSLIANQLFISNGNSVDLSAYLDNTDAQTLSLVGNMLSISNGNSIDLALYLDNTDNQVLSLDPDGVTLRLGNGTGADTTVDLSSFTPLPGTGNNVLTETSFSTNVLQVKAGPGAMTLFHTLLYPVDANVVDGKTRRINYVFDYTKTIGVSTLAFSFNIGGGMIINIPPNAIGNSSIASGTIFVEIKISFRAGLGAYAYVSLKRYVSGSLAFENIFKTPLGTWTKTIANNVDVNWQVISGTPTHTLTLLNVTSELL